MRLFACILFILLPSFMFAAGSSSQSLANDSGKATITEIKTNTGNTFVLSFVPESQYLYDVYITGRGFQMPVDTLLFDEIEHVDTIVTADLDKDGFEELYLFTRGFKPGEYAHIFGIASDSDITYKEIYFPQLKPEEIGSGGPFEGYNGRDVFVIRNNVLERTFPVHKKGDTYENASGGFRTFYYTIEKKDGGIFYKRME